MEFIKTKFPSCTVLLMYECGSHAYGISSSNSDKDIVVVLEGIEGVFHHKDYERNIEYFIFSKSEWIKKMNGDLNSALYFTLFPDEILNGEYIYLDDSFTETYQTVRNRNYGEIIDWHIQNVIRFFETYIKDGVLVKSLWHLYRVEEQVARYIHTSVWSLELSSTTKEKIQVYKENYQSQSRVYLTELEAILTYLKGVIHHE